MSWDEGCKELVDEVGGALMAGRLPDERPATPKGED